MLSYLPFLQSPHTRNALVTAAVARGLFLRLSVVPHQGKDDSYTPSFQLRNTAEAHIDRCFGIYPPLVDSYLSVADDGCVCTVVHARSVLGHDVWCWF